MQPLSDLLQENVAEIAERLYLGYVRWNNLVKKLDRWERQPGTVFNDEQVWTFLAACGYAIGGADGLAGLTRVLTGTDLPQPEEPKVWMEVLPLPPRQSEGNTHVDLALGAVSRRWNTKSGIELCKGSTLWICFCEMKWASDISSEVKHDSNRNQLARLIENALCFQGNGGLADDIYVALVTPEIWKDEEQNHREYQSKFWEYRSDNARLLQDLDSCVLGESTRPDWRYPADMMERINRLKLRWPTYEELFAGIPDSQISEGIKQFREQYGYGPGAGLQV